MIMMNYFCGMVDWRKTLALFPAKTVVSGSHNCKSFEMSRTGFEPAQDLGSHFVKWSCTVVTATTPGRHLVTVKQSRYLHDHNLHKK